MRLKVLSAIFIGLCGVAQADPAEGIWKTEPDKKGIVAHVTVYDCGDAMCGKITRTFDTSGREIKAASLGQRVIRDAKATGNGLYKGRAFIPAHRREYPAGMTLKGNLLTVKGCVGPVCMSQNWTRVQ